MPTTLRITVPKLGKGSLVPSAQHAPSPVARPRASANSHRRGAANGNHALLNGRIDVVDSQHLIHGSHLNGFGGHSEYHASGFILRKYQAASGLDRSCAVGSIISHA